MVHIICHRAGLTMDQKGSHRNFVTKRSSSGTFVLSLQVLILDSSQTTPYYDLKRSPARCAPHAPDIPLGDSARDFLCRDAHLVASTGQSRADGIPCQSAAIDEVLKAPIYWGYEQQPSNTLLRGFFVRESRAHPTHAGARQLLVISLLTASHRATFSGRDAVKSRDENRRSPLPRRPWAVSSRYASGGSADVGTKDRTKKRARRLIKALCWDNRTELPCARERMRPESRRGLYCGDNA
ncbi:hypothetical protein EVAR_48106_1 [Eumeta japonica]|uniref:Uncharacterized protein n=1 Tax=Eumeta variegata TaxID=151549 RepID=A0A4C1XNL6_EUMVA|nr:hypothetical protein EVAR_48106_1 [Eumeta japonica]